MQIWERDNGVCWACDRNITWDEYQLGHIVEHMVGGLDVPWNLAVMCAQCNRVKPVHSTPEDAEAWRKKTNGYLGEVATPMANRMLQFARDEGWGDEEMLKAAEMMDALVSQMRERRKAA